MLSCAFPASTFPLHKTVVELIKLALTLHKTICSKDVLKDPTFSAGLEDTRAQLQIYPKRLFVADRSKADDFSLLSLTQKSWVRPVFYSQSYMLSSGLIPLVSIVIYSWSPK